MLQINKINSPSNKRLFSYTMLIRRNCCSCLLCPCSAVSVGREPTCLSSAVLCLKAPIYHSPRHAHHCSLWVYQKVFIQSNPETLVCLKHHTLSFSNFVSLIFFAPYCFSFLFLLLCSSLHLCTFLYIRTGIIDKTATMSKQDAEMLICKQTCTTCHHT